MQEREVKKTSEDDGAGEKRALPGMPSTEEILEKINAIQTALGETGRYKALPEIPEEVQYRLANVRILMLDDNAAQLAAWSPSILAATNGKVDVIHHGGINSRELLDQVLAMQPDVLLLDYELANGIRGEDLLPMIRRKIPQCIVVGFSADGYHNNLLLAAGADMIANKNNSNHGSELSKIAALVSERQGLSIEGVATSLSRRVETGMDEIEARFNLEFGREAVQELITLLANKMEWRDTTEGKVASGLRTAAEQYELVMERLLEGIESPFVQYLAVLGGRSYYDAEHAVTLSYGEGYSDIVSKKGDSLFQVLPEDLAEALSSFEILEMATNGSKSALLFNCGEKNERRIIVGKEKISLTNVFRHSYFDIAPNGKPFARCCTNRGGGRAFFDGERLMSHPSFYTCAPKVSFFKDGYIVNSYNCTIVNGMLYPLVNLDDVVAHTTGAFCGMVDFTVKDAVSSYQKNDALAEVLEIDSVGVLHLSDRKVKPIGVFRPSKTELKEDGFVHYLWSEFVEL